MKAKPLIALMMSILLLAGCSAVSEKKTYFYSLSPIVEVPTNSPAPSSDFSLGLGPMAFPKLLDRPQIITRSGDNKIEREEFHQWGGSLEQEFLQVLVDNLETLTRSSRIYIYPWDSRRRPKYQVRLTVSRFDGKPGKQVQLRVRWQLLGERGKSEIKVQQSLITEPVSGTTFSDYVAAQSRAIAQLAREIKAALP